MTVDSISGTINGQTLEGIAYLEEGREIGQIVFDDPPPSGFISMYGKSWKCKCHKKVALPEPDAINLYRYGDYEVHSRMTYPTGDVIITFAEIKNWDNPEVRRCLMINGNYTGRTDAITVLPRDGFYERQDRE